MTDPTSVPHRDETAPLDQTHGPSTGGHVQEPWQERTHEDVFDDPPQAGASTDQVDQPAPTESQTDLLARQITGSDDHVGMTALWRLTMGLPHWWFVAVGTEGEESPAAAEINGQLMLLAFTDAARARHFAVGSRMIEPADDLSAIALPPHDVVEAAGTYASAGIAGLMFDPQLSGYFIPTSQLPIVWDAVNGEATGTARDGAEPV